MADLRKAKMQMQLGQAGCKQLQSCMMHLSDLLEKKNHEEFQMYSQ
jgi:hypothetical protein